MQNTPQIKAEMNKRNGNQNTPAAGTSPENNLTFNDLKNNEPTNRRNEMSTPMNLYKIDENSRIRRCTRNGQYEVIGNAAGLDADHRAALLAELRAKTATPNRPNRANARAIAAQHIAAASK